MLAKLTAKNQISLPKAIVKNFPDVQYFDVSLRNGEIVLSPVVVARVNERLKAIRAKIKRLGLTEKAVDEAIRQEYLRVLAYPKFKLTPEEVRDAIEELLPSAEVAAPKRRLRIIRRDPADNRFLECALAANAQYLVSGDDDLLSLETFQGIRVVSVTEFLAILEGTA